MLSDSSESRRRVEDQAEGLRQLCKPESHTSQSACGSPRVLKWPRIVLISELPSSDMGARFAFHLACALGGSTDHPSSAGQQSLLLDLAPAASRLPQALADRLPADRYPPLWSQLAAGRSLATLNIGGLDSLAVAAEYKLDPTVLDQLPRLYEQLVRQLSRTHDRWGWIVMLALDHIVPLDRSCWQAADDIILIGGAGASGCLRQAAALQSRLSQLEPERSLWTLPKRRPRWFARRSESSLASRWMEAGLAPQPLPEVAWPHESVDGQIVPGSRADHALHRSAARVAEHLRASSSSSPAPFAISA